MAQQPMRSEEELCPNDNRVEVNVSNLRFILDEIHIEPLFNITMEILKQHSIINSITLTTDPPEIYMQQFWHTSGAPTLGRGKGKGYMKSGGIEINIPKAKKKSEVPRRKRSITFVDNLLEDPDEALQLVAQINLEEIKKALEEGMGAAPDSLYHNDSSDNSIWNSTDDDKTRSGYSDHGDASDNSDHEDENDDSEKDSDAGEDQTSDFGILVHDKEKVQTQPELQPHSPSVTIILHKDVSRHGIFTSYNKSSTNKVKEETSKEPSQKEIQRLEEHEKKLSTLTQINHAEAIEDSVKANMLKFVPQSTSTPSADPIESTKTSTKKRSHNDQDPYENREGEKKMKRRKGVGGSSSKKDDLDLRSVETEFPAIVFNDSLTSNETSSCEPTVSSPNDEIEFRISFDESDDEDYMPTVSCIDDLYFFKEFENEFPAIVYNDALTSKSNFSTEPTLFPQHIDEFDLKDETSFLEYDEVKQSVLYLNDLFPFNIVYLDNQNSDKGNDENEIDMIRSLEDNENTNKLLKESHDKIRKVFIMGSFIMGLNVNIMGQDMALPPRDQRHKYLRIKPGSKFSTIVREYVTEPSKMFNGEVEMLSLYMRCSTEESRCYGYTFDGQRRSRDAVVVYEMFNGGVEMISLYIRCSTEESRCYRYTLDVQRMSQDAIVVHEMFNG
ncbi:hypothetical protein Tco_1200446 [Tanacetum coccineum]